MQTHQILFEALHQQRFATKIQAIKALKEIAEHQPELIHAHHPELFQLLKEGPEQLKWGIMILISMSAHLDPESIYEHLGLLGHIADGPSVIARDHYVRMLALLIPNPQYADVAIPLLLDEVLKSPVNQLPSYATTAAKCLPASYYPALSERIRLRLPDVVEYPPKEKKLQQLLKHLKKA